MLRSEIVLRLLEARGLVGADLESFLCPTLDRRAAPESLPGVVAAADVMLAAIAAGRKIVVFGDYDCDGVCAAAILVRTLSALGADVAPFLPDRMTEGYGMSDASVSRMFDANPCVGLVVTVDNGINSVKQVSDLRARGVDVIVTDHHLPGEELPLANVLVNPKVDSPPALDGICGAGVAFLIAERLVSEARRRGLCGELRLAGPLVVLAGLATVTDVVPLLGQNRILVAEALKRFDSWAPTGLRELYIRAARSGGRHTARDFSHGIGPRMNAAGRMASGRDALDLVLANDREKARELAMKVDEYNFKRKSIELKMTDDAMAKVVQGAAAQVIDLPDGHPGVAGIVAARVMDRLEDKVPVCVIAGGHGSARSPERINIRAALAACEDALTTYGGHAAAAGFSVKPGRTEDLRQMLCEYCAACRGAERRAQPVVDAWLEPSDITLELAEDLQCLEPFGEGNPEPVFGLRDVHFSDIKPVGADGRHLGMTLRGSGLRAVYWNVGDQIEKLRAKTGPHTLSFHVVVSTYQSRHAELRILSIAS